jgi:hypothetical protein
MDCPKCGLTSPDNALYCDCGYPFYLDHSKPDMTDPAAPYPAIGTRAKSLYSSSKTAYLFWFCSILLFMLSVASPAISMKGGDRFGITALALGPFALIPFMKLGGIGWLANPLIVLSAIFIWKSARWPALIFAVGAVALASGSIAMMEQFPFPVDESGSPGSLTVTPLLGYWFWLSSMVLMLLSGVALTLNSSNEPS